MESKDVILLVIFLHAYSILDYRFIINKRKHFERNLKLFVLIVGSCITTGIWNSTNLYLRISVGSSVPYLIEDLSGLLECFCVFAIATYVRYKFDVLQILTKEII